MTERLPSDVVEARLNHLIDRARRGALLPEEADRFTTELRDLVRRLEDTKDERDAALKAVEYFDAQSKRRQQRADQAEAAIDRVRELATQWAVLRTYGGAAYELRAALDQPQQPTTTEASC
ncbi:hypothetical protein AB0I93_26900 [Streptomyces sp. NPDC049967]|uniref:hypothetical protein n=1 Tax=Streptomyces sp. NPDC049967 TaxID=3155658 RepID=UPI0034451446